MSRHIVIDARIWRKETGGLGRYVRNLVRELVAIDTVNRYTIIITPADEAQYDVTAPNFTKCVVDIPHYSVAEQRNLPKVIKSLKPDLVHFTHFNHPILYRGPFVVTIHDLIMHLFPSGAQRRSLIRKLAYRKVMDDTKRAKKIIVPSLSTKNDLVSMLNFPADKIVVTPEGSEGAFRTHSETEKKAIRQKLGLPERYVLFVSRWEKYKGLLALVEAFERLSKNDPELALVITGKPAKQNPEVGEFIYQKQKNGLKIITPGFIADEDLAPLYSAASVYVHPSWYEGFGIMILEAFSSGVPVVTSNSSSLPEIVGDAGLLVDPRNVDELCAAIKSILDDPNLAQTLSKRGLERVKSYSWAKMAASTRDIYESLLQ